MKHLRINTPGVVHETVDGEVVIVNLDNGLYFSTDRVGTGVWAQLVAGRSVSEIVEWAQETYDVDPDTVTGDITAFLTKLEDNRLVVPVDGAPEPEPGVESTVAPTTNGYVAPDLQVYADMEELLLLDPVHDVGDAGWPNTA